MQQNICCKITPLIISQFFGGRETQWQTMGWCSHILFASKGFFEQLYYCGPDHFIAHTNFRISFFGQVYIENLLGKFDIYKHISFITSSTRSSSHHKLKQNLCCTSHYRHFYFNCIVKLWNAFSKFDISLFITCTKSLLSRHLRNHFITHFNPEDSCTFHFVCPYNSCYCPMLTIRLCLTDGYFFQQNTMSYFWW